jgi:hypothetical protein
MFSPFGFSIQEFYICLFYCQKTAFVCEFQHTPLWKMIFSSMFHTSCGYEILRLIPYLLLKMVFLAFKTLLFLFGTGKKNRFINFECYDLANGEE